MSTHKTEIKHIKSDAKQIVSMHGSSITWAELRDELLQRHDQDVLKQHSKSLRQWLKDVKRGKIMKKVTDKMNRISDH
jgi:pyruvate/2-oxoglutarate dehydrogenase complex dihydrolipoamide dehydrogenase (E3) component